MKRGHDMKKRKCKLPNWDHWAFDKFSMPIRQYVAQHFHWFWTIWEDKEKHTVWQNHLNHYKLKRRIWLKRGSIKRGFSIGDILTWKETKWDSALCQMMKNMGLNWSENLKTKTLHFRAEVFSFHVINFHNLVDRNSWKFMNMKTHK